MSLVLFKNIVNEICFSNGIYLMCIYKEDLALSNPQWLKCHKIKPNQIIYLIYMYEEDLALNIPQWLIGHRIKPNQTSDRIQTSICFIGGLLFSFYPFKYILHLLGLLCGHFQWFEFGKEWYLTISILIV